MKPLSDFLSFKFLQFLALIYFSLLTGCSFNQNTLKDSIKLTDFEKSIAQKLMLDIRYFCNKKTAKNQKCLKPVTHLPTSLKTMIANTNIGGVILFAENIQSIKQTIKLTHKLQQAAKTPLFIAIDQEGGRVIRLPGTLGTSFSGNMAIGATYPKFNVYYAKRVGEIIGQELSLLGINVDFAPDVDVNTNPENPVINIRSFGENANKVAQLGQAMTTGIEQYIIATLKHFPGHGNTNIDSHSGLPSINTPKTTFQKSDLLPFARIIKNSPPGMIMSAHIQYPKLDHTTLLSSSGKQIIKPATMSYKILTSLLRQQLNYHGVIITDALNMASISKHFSPLDAVINTFQAGADIALMPIKIRYKSDIPKFKMFIRKLAKAYKNTSNYQNNLVRSLQRISFLKHKMLKNKEHYTLRKRLKLANENIGNSTHRLVEKQLAQHAITLLKNDNNLIPIKIFQNNKILLIGNNNIKLHYLKNKLKSNFYTRFHYRPDISLFNISSSDQKKLKKSIKNNRIILILFTPDFKSPVVSHKITSDIQGLSNTQYLTQIRSIINFSKLKNKPVVLAVMGSPYAAHPFLSSSAAVVTTYSSNFFKIKNHIIAPDYEALSLLLSGKIKSTGQLPVTLKKTLSP